MFVDVIMSLETPFFPVCVQTERKANFRNKAVAYKSNGRTRLDTSPPRAPRIGARMGLHQHFST